MAGSIDSFHAYGSLYCLLFLHHGQWDVRGFVSEGTCVTGWGIAVIITGIAHAIVPYVHKGLWPPSYCVLPSVSMSLAHLLLI